MNARELHARASELFAELRTLPEPARQARLDALAPRALADEVRSLLAHDVPDVPEAGAAPTEVLDAPRAGAALPAAFGPYRVLRRIGRGGSGQVFLAEQDQPVRRRVAVKVVPQAALDPDLAARFDVERRALERLTHPNVVRLLDAGRTPEALPYLVMEFVDGVPLTEHCARHALGLEARVALLLQVAAGIEHAHQRGVIHRDLKPANVVVATASDPPTPIVLDFGIAKAHTGPLAGTFTADLPATSGGALGTPGYMAPEQAGGGEIDTRTDVYALGALLYELICGHPPLEPAGDLAATFARLRDVVPPPPSRRRAAREPEAPPALLGDLDAIALRSLAKEPERRYPSVSAWRADVERALAAQPIEARPPTWRYRARCFVRRERKLAFALAATGAALLLGVIGLSLGLLAAAREQRVAAQERQSQEEINTFLAEDVLAAATPDQLGPEAKVEQLLRHAAARIDARFATKPHIAAALHHTLGEVHAQLAAFDAAERHLRQAIELRARHFGDAHDATLRSRLAAASLLVRRENYAAGEAELRQLLEQARRQLPADDAALYGAINDLGVALSGLGRDAQALPLLEEALAGRQRLRGATSPDAFLTLSNIAVVRSNIGPSEAAIAAFEAAIAAARALPTPPRWTLLGLENNLGATLQDVERNEEAKPHLLAALALAEQLFPPEHAYALQIRANLAGIEADLGQPAAAMAAYAEVAGRMRTALGPAAEPTLAARHGQWTSASRAKQHAAAVAGFTQLLADITRDLAATHPLVAKTRQSLAVALREAGDPAAALPHAQQAAQEFEAQLGKEHVRVKAAWQLVEQLQTARGQ